MPFRPTPPSRWSHLEVWFVASGKKEWDKIAALAGLDLKQYKLSLLHLIWTTYLKGNYSFNFRDLIFNYFITLLYGPLEV